MKTIDSVENLIKCTRGESRGWCRCSKQLPCSICGKPDWCTISPDGQFACCMRVSYQSIKQLRNGGYLFRLDRLYAVPRWLPKPKIATKQLDFQKIAKQDALPLPAYPAGYGAPADDLAYLGAWWSRRYDALAVPMFNSQREIVGIRIRAKNGKKWSWPGGHEGVFLPDGKMPYGEMAFVCEGPTDTAALLSLGFWAVGRPSNIGGHDTLVSVLKACRRITICADRDEGAATEQTTAGAQKLARVCSAWAVVRLFRPPTKDMRAWIVAGATKETVLCVVNAH